MKLTGSGLRIAIGLVASLAVAFGLQYLHAGDALDRKLLDAQFRFLREHYPRPVENDVVIVGIDEDAFNAFREPFALWHPHLGKFLEAVAKAKPSVIGLDIALPERSYQFLVPNYDQKLLQGLMAAKSQAPVVLGQTMDDRGQFRPVFPPYIAVTGGDSLASVMVCRDPDGVVRRFEGNLCDEGSQVTALTEKMAAALGAKREQHGWVDFSIGGLFDYVPFLKVLEWSDQGNIEQLTKIFQGRPVLLGAALPFLDRVQFPVPLAAWEPGNALLPGVLLHGQILRSMQTNGLVRPVSNGMVWLLTVLAAAFWLGRSGWLKTAIFILFPFALLGLSLSQLWHTHYLAIGGILLTAAFAFGSRLSYDAFAQMRERQLLRNTFGSYVSPQVMQEIMAGNIKPGLGGARKRVCILFSDIRNFTTRSEAMPPEEVIAMLNLYFTEMTGAVHQYRGTVDKFIGDGLMVFFGAPQGLELPERNAFAAAQEMLTRLRSVNEKLQQKNIEPIRIGIGIHVGEVVIGHVGSELRHEYTAIGDAVNVASRLEGLSKTLGHVVICSEAVVHELVGEDGFEDLGEQAVKGHSKVRVYGWNPVDPGDTHK